MLRSRTALSARRRQQVAARNHRITHTATAESSNPHNVALLPRGFVLGRFPYAGPVPRRATCGGRRPKTFTISAGQPELVISRKQTSCRRCALTIMGTDGRAGTAFAIWVSALLALRS